MDPDRITTQEGLYWHEQFMRERTVSNSLREQLSDARTRLRRTRDLLTRMDEKQSLAQSEKPADAPVVNEGTSTLEQRVNKLERNVETYGKVFDTVDVTLNVLIDRLKKLEQREPVETKVNVNLSDMVIKGAAMLDLADAVNRSINKRGRPL